MRRYAYDLILLADRSAIFREMGSGFRDKRETFNPTDLLWWLVAVVGVLVAFLVVANMLAKQDKHRMYRSPRALFNALCKANGLDRASRSLLRQLAAASELESPARLFVEPDRFDLHRLPSTLRPQAGALAALHQRIFAVVEQPKPDEVNPA
jgi:hypothetical protein